jgi:hypothetical protein
MLFIEIDKGNISGNFVNLCNDWLKNGKQPNIGQSGITIYIQSTSEQNRPKISFGNISLLAMGTYGQLFIEDTNKMYIIVDYAHTVYCYGYTNDEITAKTSSGGEWEGYNIRNANA